VWAADLFDTIFKADTMSKQAGQRYRDIVLRLGGSQPAMETLNNILGRKPRPDAFFEWGGIQ
jgi:metallopeptidase MepB